jgi:transcriptional regulator CtsR
MIKTKILKMASLKSAKRKKSGKIVRVEIARKLQCNPSYVCDVLNTRKCRKKPRRITNNEYKLIVKMRNG